MNKLKFTITGFLIILCLTFGAAENFAQTTVFTYQGKLTDGGMAATATYDMIFRLYDDAAAGSQIGSSVNNPTVQVANGIFTVQLDFGAAAFSGADRYLEVNIRPAGSSGGYTQLLPRQKITSAPQSIRSLNAANADNAANATNATTATNSNQLGGVAANQFVQTNDTRLTDARNPLAGSANYIQANPSTQQTSTNFNISGSGTAGGTISANNFSAITQYNLGSSRLLSAPGAGSVSNGIPANTNTFGGIGAGTSNNAATNITGNYNSFFGYNAGTANTTGYSNTFYGAYAGSANTTGSSNNFFGNSAGGSNTTGNLNSFFGYGAGSANTTGGLNTIIGYQANVSVNNLTYATAIGADAAVGSSNTIALGRTDGSDTVLAYGKIQVNTLGSAGSTTLCRNASNQISTCSSSLRYKTNIAPFAFGLNFINQLRPISFDWKEGGMKDVGFGAEDVARVNSLFVNYNEKGEVEGVKYDRFSVLFVNAFKEQQAQIENQQRQIAEQAKQLAEQRTMIENLRKIVSQKTGKKSGGQGRRK